VDVKFAPTGKMSGQLAGFVASKSTVSHPSCMCEAGPVGFAPVDFIGRPFGCGTLFGSDFTLGSRHSGDVLQCRLLVSFLPPGQDRTERTSPDHTTLHSNLDCGSVQQHVSAAQLTRILQSSGTRLGRIDFLRARRRPAIATLGVFLIISPHLGVV
jgi:hypothetical protein